MLPTRTGRGFGQLGLAWTGGFFALAASDERDDGERDSVTDHRRKPRWRTAARSSTEPPYGLPDQHPARFEAADHTSSEEDLAALRRLDRVVGGIAHDEPHEPRSIRAGLEADIDRQLRA